jgi:hypothetical protein
MSVLSKVSGGRIRCFKPCGGRQQTACMVSTHILEYRTACTARRTYTTVTTIRSSVHQRLMGAPFLCTSRINGCTVHVKVQPLIFDVQRGPCTLPAPPLHLLRRVCNQASDPSTSRGAGSHMCARAGQATLPSRPP